MDPLAQDLASELVSSAVTLCAWCSVVSFLVGALVHRFVFTEPA